MELMEYRLNNWNAPFDVNNSAASSAMIVFFHVSLWFTDFCSQGQFEFYFGAACSAFILVSSDLHDQNCWQHSSSLGNRRSRVGGKRGWVGGWFPPECAEMGNSSLTTWPTGLLLISFKQFQMEKCQRERNWNQSVRRPKKCKKNGKKNSCWQS